MKSSNTDIILANSGDLLSTTHCVLPSDPVEILIDMDVNTHSQLRQFAIDHNIVTADAECPNIASAINEILNVVMVGETDEERLLVRIILGFYWGEERAERVDTVPKIASNLDAIVRVVLDIHQYANDKALQRGADFQETIGGTTLEFLRFLLETCLMIYRFEGIRGYNIVDFIEETEKNGGDVVSEIGSFIMEFHQSAMKEYMIEHGYDR